MTTPQNDGLVAAPPHCVNTMKNWRTTAFVILILAFLGLGAPSAWSAPAAADSESQIRPLALAGIRQLMNGQPDAAIPTFRRVEQQDSSSPLGYLLEADATWWKIYYSTANLIDPDVFDVVTTSSTPYDSHFEDLVKIAIQKAQTRIDAHQDEARSYLYEGMAYALRARLEGLRAKDMPTARAGKKMRSLLLKALELDPHLTDAYAGVGLYNYFVDTLPTIVKVLGFFIGLPSGDRAKGLEQLQQAAEHGEYTRAEAKFYLAKDYTRRNEMQFTKSLQLFQELAAEFPQNPFWKLMVASVHMRLGQRDQGEAMYRQILAATANQNGLPAKPVHHAVNQALERLHLGQKFE
ncbi:MAG TPA: hypothetical protein VFZ08_11375 [Terriglobia bacterium]|nr:hypothetical protein [Terriglobia bacterium]